MHNNGNVLFSCIIPVYNEKIQLYKNVYELVRRCETLNITFEIIISDDGSTDSTPKIAEDLISEDPRVNYIRLKTNSGRGEAVSRGFRTASGQILAFMDIDLATNLDSLPDLINIIKNGADVAVGSRWLEDAVVKRSYYRKFISFMYNYFVRLIFDSKVKDHQCGFKAFKSNVAMELLNETEERNDRLWAWDAELLILAQKKGYNIVEFPVRWHEAKKSNFKFWKDVPTVFIYLVKLRYRLRKS